MLLQQNNGPSNRLMSTMLFFKKILPEKSICPNLLVLLIEIVRHLFVDSASRFMASNKHHALSKSLSSNISWTTASPPLLSILHYSSAPPVPQSPMFLSMSMISSSPATTTIRFHKFFTTSLIVSQSKCQRIFITSLV